MKLTIAKSIAAQVAATAAQVGIQTSPDVSDQIQQWSAVVITLVQVGLAVLAHFRTPQGEKLGKSE